MKGCILHERGLNEVRRICKFAMSAISVKAFDDTRFEWSNGVPQHTIESNDTLTITPTPSLDYWTRTFYEPLLISDTRVVSNPRGHIPPELSAQST